MGSVGGGISGGFAKSQTDTKSQTTPLPQFPGEGALRRGSIEFGQAGLRGLESVQFDPTSRLAEIEARLAERLPREAGRIKEIDTQLQRAKGDKERARLTKEREKLAKTTAISPEERDKLMAEREQLIPQVEQFKAMTARANQNLLDRLTGKAPFVSPEEQTALDELFGTMKARGTQDIQRFAGDLAASRGLMTSDSPIGNEALRTQRDFLEGLTAQQIQATFNRADTSQAMNERLAAFQANLKQQAFQNRLNFAGTVPFGAQFGNTLFGQRLAAGKTIGKSNTSGWNIKGNIQAGYGMGGMGGG